MDNNGGLRTSIGMPNRDFGPSELSVVMKWTHDAFIPFIDIFKLEPGSQAGQYIIYTYAMIPSNPGNLYALTVVKDMSSGEYQLKYGNKNGYNYDWRFILNGDGNFAIRWYSTSDKNVSFILYLDDDDVLKLASYGADESPSPKHFISNFHPIS